MIRLTRLDGSQIFVNEQNIQWIEVLPDTAITFLGGARLLVKEKVEEVVQAIQKEASALRVSAAPTRESI